MEELNHVHSTLGRCLCPICIVASMAHDEKGVRYPFNINVSNQPGDCYRRNFTQTAVPGLSESTYLGQFHKPYHAQRLAFPCILTKKLVGSRQSALSAGQHMLLTPSFFAQGSSSSSQVQLLKMRKADTAAGGADHGLMLKEKSNALNNMWYAHTHTQVYEHKPSRLLMR